MIWDNGWIWLIAALLLAAVELLLPGWFFMGMAVAVGVMGLALLAGLWPWGLPVALVVTAALTGAVWLGLRRGLGSARGSVKVWDRDIND